LSKVEKVRKPNGFLRLPKIVTGVGASFKREEKV